MLHTTRYQYPARYYYLRAIAYGYWWSSPPYHHTKCPFLASFGIDPKDWLWELRWVTVLLDNNNGKVGPKLKQHIGLWALIDGNYTSSGHLDVTKIITVLSNFCLLGWYIGSTLTSRSVCHYLRTHVHCLRKTNGLASPVPALYRNHHNLHLFLTETTYRTSERDSRVNYEFSILWE